MPTQNIAENIGVYTNPKHELWVGEAAPSAQDISNNNLELGQVTIAIRSTGICGYAPMR